MKNLPRVLIGLGASIVVTMLGNYYGPITAIAMATYCIIAFQEIK